MTEQFTDRTLVCRDCGQDFIFTAGEQEFFKLKDLKNEPVRCKDCRDKKRANRNNNFRQNRNFDSNRAA